jgi:hypothetical protein
MLIAKTHMAEVSLEYREEVATSTGNGTWYLLIPVVAIAIGFIAFKYINREPPILNTPGGMLHELCRAHRINSAGRTLLERIVEEAEIQHPAIVCIGEDQFEDAVEKARPIIKYNRKQESTLGMLRRRLFA